MLWRKLPWITLVGTIAPLVCLGLLHWTFASDTDPAQTRWLQMADFMVGGIVVLHWTLVLTVAVGCVIVMVMKGPGYVADGYKVSHSDQPRREQETAQEAASNRSSTSKMTASE
jgi:hypothetical protein